MALQFPDDIIFRQFRERLRQGRFTPHVGDGYPRPLRGQEAGTGDAGFGQANDKDIFVAIVHQNTYLIFRVEIATSARMMLIIQKRTMIFGSATPFSSKW